MQPSFDFPQPLTEKYQHVSRNGAWASFELKAHEAAQYRYRNGRKRVAWEALPEAVRSSVAAWAKL
jgi:hypothetical protein